jgi:hypothetical protein
MVKRLLKDVQSLLVFQIYHRLSTRDLSSVLAHPILVRLTNHLDGDNLLGNIMGRLPYCPKGACPQLL